MKVLVLGDMITSGYRLHSQQTFSSVLERMLRQNGYGSITVVDYTNPYYTTSAVLEQMENVLAHRPDVVVLQLGSNDARRLVATHAIYNNISNIVGRLQQRGAYVVLMGVSLGEDGDPSYNIQLQNSFDRIADFYRLAYYPDAMRGISGVSEYLLADGVYPNGMGVEIMVGQVYHLVDAGLRWKWDRINDQRGFQPEIKEALPPAMPPTVEPRPLSPAVGR
ncbi:MAG: GDSL-type esterase/lipase family protein [Alphaproteobacteria bacterium]|nr:GDSL-type esterase/lipase family protein [Alphaproteobacteria bacterium]